MMITECKFSHDQIKKLSKEMVILVDTKEKVNDHITNYFDKKGIACLLYTSYMCLIEYKKTGPTKRYID